MDHASRTRRPNIQNIARSYTAMLIFLAPSIFTTIIEHVAGVNNDGVGSLSRPYQFPTCSSTSAVSPYLSPLTAYGIPVGLLSRLHCLVTVP